MLSPDEAALLAAQPGALVAVTADDLVAYATPEAHALLGWDTSLVGRPLTAIIPARLRPRHTEGFARYVRTGESRLEGKTVRVPALTRAGREVLVDLTIRVFQRPDGTRLAVAALSEAALGFAPAGLVRIETEFRQRLYELI